MHNALVFILGAGTLLAAAGGAVHLHSGKKEAPAPAVALTAPVTRTHITCARDSQGLYRCPIKGTSQGVKGTHSRLLLWLKPVKPAADGWYLQRGSINGIADGIEDDGGWRGTVQLGNTEYPPHEGDIVEVAVTIAPEDKAAQLFSEPGVVVRGDPGGTSSARATEVSVQLL
jgi:hypothetical protein